MGNKVIKDLQGKTLTVPEVMELLDMSRTGVYNAIREGRLQAYKCGRNYKITEQQLYDFTQRRIKRK